MKGCFMKFFMSSESDSRYDDFGEALCRIRNELEPTIKNCIKDKDYGSEVEDFAVICIIIKFDKQMEAEGWFKERKLFKKKAKEADMRLRINYDKFVKGDDNIKRLLLIDNVIRSIQELGKLAKKDFHAEELQNDILKAFNLTIQDLQAI
jgi:hypothetical protein